MISVDLQTYVIPEVIIHAVQVKLSIVSLRSR